MDRHPRSLALAGGARRTRLHRDVLGVAAMRAHNHDLAWRSAVRLGERWGRPWTSREAMVGCMVTVPLPARLGPASVDNAQRLATRCCSTTRIEAPVMARGGALWARAVDAGLQHDDDVERFADAVDSLAAI